MEPQTPPIPPTEPNAGTPPPQGPTVFGPQTTVNQPSETNPPQVSSPPSYGQYQPEANPFPATGMPIAQTYSQPISNEGSKSFLVAFLLSMFLGVFGVDRFYLGKIGTGILKLLTFGGLGIWVTIDFILILCGVTKAKDGTALKDYHKNRKIAFVVFFAWLLMWVAAGVYDILVIQRTTSTLSKGVSVSVGNTNSTSPAATTDTPIGTAVTADGFSVKVLKVTPNPQVTGDAPNTGTQYVEIDLSATNTGNQQQDIDSSTFYYQTVAGKLLETADTGGTNAPNKNVQVVGKQSMIADFLSAGQTDNTKYVIYQVPTGDKGKLIWYEQSLLLDASSKKLAIFDLN